MSLVIDKRKLRPNEICPCISQAPGAALIWENAAAVVPADKPPPRALSVGIHRLSMHLKGNALLAKLGLRRNRGLSCSLRLRLLDPRPKTFRGLGQGAEVIQQSVFQLGADGLTTSGQAVEMAAAEHMHCELKVRWRRRAETQGKATGAWEGMWVLHYFCEPAVSL